MRSIAPSPDLAAFVREITVVEVGEEVTRVRLPEAGLVLAVRYLGSASVVAAEGETRLADVVLTGMTNTARRMRTAAGSGVILALFHPGGAAPFFEQPLHELFGASVSLEELVARSDVDRLEARMREATSDGERALVLESFLRARLRGRSPDALVAAAVRAIRDTKGALQVGALARKLFISQDALEKRFRRAVGASPKQLASLLRVRQAIDAYRPGARLSQIALDAGYFDQSHFNREVRAVTGEAPGRFFRAGRHL